MEVVVFAIDPGADGGFAAIFPDGKVVTYKTRTNLEEIIDTLKFPRSYPKYVAFESVHAIFGARASTTFSFGKAVGFWTGVLYSLGYVNNQIFPVKPVEWQRFACNPIKKPNIKGLTAKKRKAINTQHRINLKQESIRAANNAFPFLNLDHDGEADAVNMARWLKNELEMIRIGL